MFRFPRFKSYQDRLNETHIQLNLLGSTLPSIGDHFMQPQGEKVCGIVPQSRCGR
jgi:hypothetical protein